MSVNRWQRALASGGRLALAGQPERAGGQLPAMSLARAQRLYRGPAVPASGLKELLSRYARQCAGRASAGNR
jgi:hypothetical protein